MSSAPALEPVDAALVAARVRAALEEDSAGQDATTAFVGIGSEPASAEIRAGADGVLCGIDIAREVFRQVDASVEFDARARDGDQIAAGACILSVRGPARSILAGERTALNFLHRLCGVATLSACYVDRVRGTGVTILDTRKTTPLWRDLEKYAVRCGGATNHRRDLGAMVLVKDNHVRAVGGPRAVLERIAAAPRASFVEVEVDSLAFLRELLASPAATRIDRVMLDNLTPANVASAVAEVVRYRSSGARLEIEVSGGITLETIRAFALPGVDFISVGALTHSAVALPMSLDLS